MFPKKKLEDLPSYRYILMSSVPRSPTPRNSCCLTITTSRILHSAQAKASAFPCSVFRGSTPSATAFGPLARLSTLKVGSYPPSSKTNYRWLVNLTGRDFHPLYVKRPKLGRTAWPRDLSFPKICTFVEIVLGSAILSAYISGSVFMY